MDSVTVAQARERFADVLDQAASGAVEITRHGHPVAYIVGADMFHKLTNPDASYLFSSDDTTPAQIDIGTLASLEPAPLEGGPVLSETLEQLREERM